MFENVIESKDSYENPEISALVTLEGDDRRRKMTELIEGARDVDTGDFLSMYVDLNQRGPRLGNYLRGGGNTVTKDELDAIVEAFNTKIGSVSLCFKNQDENAIDTTPLLDKFIMLVKETIKGNDVFSYVTKPDGKTSLFDAVNFDKNKNITIDHLDIVTHIKRVKAMSYEETSNSRTPSYINVHNARVFAIGDLEGQVQVLYKILRENELISELIEKDKSFVIRWTGGEHDYVVQCGDQIDSGLPYDKMSDKYYDAQNIEITTQIDVDTGAVLSQTGNPKFLQDQPSRKVRHEPNPHKDIDTIIFTDYLQEISCGRFISIIGNHEVANVRGDFRCVNPADLNNYTNPIDIANRKKIFQHDGIIGKMLSRRNIIFQINDALFSHAGLTESVYEYEEFPTTIVEYKILLENINKCVDFILKPDSVTDDNVRDFISPEIVMEHDKGVLFNRFYDPPPKGTKWEKNIFPENKYSDVMRIMVTGHNPIDSGDIGVYKSGGDITTELEGDTIDINGINDILIDSDSMNKAGNMTYALLEAVENKFTSITRKRTKDILNLQIYDTTLYADLYN